MGLLTAAIRSRLVPHAQRPHAGAPTRCSHCFDKFPYPVSLCFNIKPISGRNQYQLEAYHVSSHIVYVSDASFDEEVLKASGPVLVDYWAEWCGPCKMIAPILDEIATEYTGKIKVAKLNIDENPQTPPRYGIRGIPTLMLFKNGSVEATKVGAVSKSQLTAFIDSNL